jgi:hypothetical protein
MEKEIKKLTEELKEVKEKVDGIVDKFIEEKLVDGSLAKPKVSLLRKLLNEFLRVSPLLALIVPFLFLDDSYKFVLFISAVLAFVLLLVHIVRKAMYPYLDIEELVIKAKESSLGASITLLGFFILIGVIIYSFAILLTK